MIFCGLAKVFSTKDDAQYEAIGAFWDFMAAQYGRENLQGLGFAWRSDTITYVIGVKQGSMEQTICYPGAEYCEVQLPDSGWVRYTGKTEQLAQLYEQIYAEGLLRYEIETFSDDGSCAVAIIRE